MVTTMVTKLELECFATEGLTQDLVTHADAEHGLLAQDIPGVVNRIGSS